MRENLIRSAVGPCALDLKLLLRGAPTCFFPAPRGHGAVIKARRVSGRVPPDVSGAQGRRPLVHLSSLPLAGFSLLSSSLPFRVLLLSLSSLPSRRFFPPLRRLAASSQFSAFSVLLSLSSSRSRYLNCPSAEIFSRIANLWTSPLADRANDVLVATYERARAREQERVIGNGRVRGRRGGRR